MEELKLRGPEGQYFWLAVGVVDTYEGLIVERFRGLDDWPRICVALVCKGEISGVGNSRDCCAIAGSDAIRLEASI